MRRIEVVIGVVWREGKILVCQRREHDSLGGYWEFPGGKVEAGETLTECLTRELMEEVGVQVRIGHPLSVIEHVYGQTRVRLNPFWCDHVAGEPQPLECQRLEWVKPEELPEIKFPPANEQLIGEILRGVESWPDWPSS